MSETEQTETPETAEVDEDVQIVRTEDEPDTAAKPKKADKA
jgi:hypothetical protein